MNTPWVWSTPPSFVRVSLYLPTTTWSAALKRPTPKAALPFTVSKAWGALVPIPTWPASAEPLPSTVTYS